MKVAASHLAPPPASHRAGRLDLRPLLDWLREDGLVSATDAEATAKRFAVGMSKQHPLVRLAGADLVRQGSDKVLDVEALTEWLATRSALRSKLASRPNRFTVITPPSASRRWQSL